MKRNKIFVFFAILAITFTGASSCQKYVDELPENKTFTGGTDYSVSSNMILPLIGTYYEFNGLEWEVYPLISVRGDDVNAGGLGDQQDFAESDIYNYNKDYWMYNSLWQNFYQNMLSANNAMEQVALYQEQATNKALGDQYIAEIKVLKSFWLFQLSRVWGSVIIPPSSTSPKRVRCPSAKTVLPALTTPS